MPAPEAESNAPRVAGATYSPEPKDPLEANLHDLTNALAAAQSYAELLSMKVKAGIVNEAPIVDAILRELERMDNIVKNVRRETYRAGDILACQSCGYTFVFRKASGKRATCRRCKGTEVARWKP